MHLQVSGLGDILRKEYSSNTGAGGSGDAKVRPLRLDSFSAVSMSSVAGDIALNGALVGLRPVLCRAIAQCLFLR